MDLLLHVEKKISLIHGIQRWVVAYSGGMDSSVLVDIMHRLKTRLDIQVVVWHVNHGLQLEADLWAVHCRQVCAALRLSLRVFPVVISPSKISALGVEAAAREARYAIFTQHLGAGDILLLAHHQDDQVETFMLRLLRGSGVKGLGAMFATRSLGKAALWRPLLDATQELLVNYAKARQLEWVQDKSNANLAYDRNYLRHEIIPRLKERWSNLNHQIAVTASICQQTNTAFEDDLKLLLPHYLIDTELNLSSFNSLSLVKRCYLMRLWLESLALPLPNYAQLLNLLTQLEKLNSNSRLEVKWAGIVVRHFRSRLYARRQQLLAADLNIYPWDLTNTANNTLALPSGEYSAHKINGGGLNISGTVQVCFRPQATHSLKTVKKVLQSHAVPPWRRNYIPLVYLDKTLLAVGSIWVRQEYCVKSANAQGWYLAWRAVDEYG